MNYLQDIEFLKTICANHKQQLSARIILLDKNEFAKEEIIGQVQNGTINLDGTSALQRTCSLSLILSRQDVILTQWVLESKIRIDIGMQNTSNKYLDEPIIWFPMGVYYLTSFSVNETSTHYAISLQGKDKMSKLNGEIGGTLNTIVDFGQIDIIDEENNITTNKISISTIIKNLVHVYGEEPYHKIFIYDLDDYGLKLMTYYGDDPLYVLIKNDKDKYPIINYTFNGNQIVYKDNEDEKGIALKKIEDKDFFISQYNLLKQKNNYTSYFLKKGSEDLEICIKKCNYGDTIGYILTDLIYADDLIANAGESLKSVLDKIINMLGVFEYYYDIDGNFIFKKQDRYAEVNSYLNPSVTYNKPIFSFVDNNLRINNNYSYDLQNIKNDYTIWGERKSSNDSNSLDIHMRIAFDEKPQEYVSIGIDEDQAKQIIKNYETFYPKLKGETDEERIKRLQKSSIIYRNIENKKSDEDEIVKGEDGTDIYYVDWREIIYQMAQDYKQYNYMQNFYKWIEQNNPKYKNGITGYERYYTDLDGFWRTLYQFKYDIVKPDEILSQSYNYKIDNSLTASNNGANLIIDKRSQLIENKFEWTIDSTKDEKEYNNYKILYYFYLYWRSVQTNEIQTIKINDSLKTEGQTGKFLNDIEQQNDISDFIENNDTDKYTVDITIKNETIQITYTASNTFSDPFIMFNNNDINKNHLIIWALINNILRDNDDKLITEFDQLKTGETYYLDSIFYYSPSQQDITERMSKMENGTEAKAKEILIKKALEQQMTRQKILISKAETFYRLQIQSLKTETDNLLYDIQVVDDFPLFKQVLNKETNKNEYVYVGSCQEIVNNNYNILSRLYDFAANKINTKSYIVAENQETNIRETNIGEAFLARLFNVNFEDAPSRFEEIHNWAWYIYDNDKGAFDVSFDDPSAIYYDITHLYKLENNTEELQTNNYIQITNYPKNKNNVSLTNLMNPAKDINQLILWGKAYNILYKISKDIDQKTHFNKNVFLDPSQLIFWFDFWETTTFCNQYSVRKIGPREFVKHDQQVVAIEYLPYFNNVFLDYQENVSSNEEKIIKFYQSDYCQHQKDLQIFRLGKNDSTLLAMSGQGLSAASAINNEIYNHSYMTQNISFNAIPQYFLQPNSLIKVINLKEQREDKYVLNKISYQLKPGSTMSIQAVKMLPEILEKQDVRKEIING